MAGKSPVTALEEERTALKALANGADRAEADRARAILLTLAGWTSARIAQAFGVREDTVRLLAARYRTTCYLSAYGAATS
jgi:DNA-directed RNA polymerase specialized sigma24 family protein